MQIIKTLQAIIQKYDLLQHTFYQAWSKGELKKEHLQKYAAQ